MCRKHEEIPDEDRRRFDRLADGELSEAERHTLLLSLDHRPNGWRQCALALLEAQCWSREMAAISGPYVQPVVARPPPPVRTPGQWSSSSRWATLAASLVTAFLLGIVTRDAMAPDAGTEGPWMVDAGPSPTGAPADVAQAQAAAARGGPPAHAQDATNGQPSADVGSGGLGPGEIQTAVAPADPSNRGPFEAAVGTDMVTFLVRGDGGSSTRAVQVPLVSAAGFSQDGRRPHESVIPGAVLRGLRQAGHQIKLQRRYAPLQLDDGRQIVFPVDDIEIMPVSFQTY